MNNNMMLMLLPLLMKGRGNGNAEMMKIMMQAFNLGTPTGAGSDPVSSLMMAMMKNKPVSTKQNESAPQQTSLPDVGGLFGQDVWNVMQLFMAMNKKN